VHEPTQQPHSIAARIADAMFGRYMQGEAPTRAYLLDRGFEPRELDQHGDAARALVSRSLRDRGIEADA
jgi:hypothetical protein